ncbi:MAG: DUF1573 domain-containing protein [Desulfomonilaceae bacterium]
MGGNMPYKSFGMILLLWLFPAILVGATGPEIVLDRSVHDFGDVQVGDVVQTEFRVINKGDAPLIIDEVRTSCGCAKAVSRSKEVPPGQETEIAVSYDSAGLSPGRKTQSVLIHTNDGKNSVSKFQVFANVVHPISIEPTNLIARRPNFQERISFPMTATNNSPQPVTLLISAVEGAISKAVFQPAQIIVQPNSETRFQIEMDLKKPDKGNVLNGALTVTTDHPKVNQIRLRCLIRFDGQK